MLHTLDAGTTTRPATAARPWLRGLALAAGIALSPLARGQPEQGQAAGEGMLEEIVVSSRVPLPLRRIATSVSVVSAQDLAARGSLSLLDVLRREPGIAGSSSGGAGTSSALRIRGEDGFRTLTLLDGIRLSDPSLPQGGTQLEHLLSSGIGRVEILRGPQGLSYGADAGGVVDISSRQGAGRGLGLGLDAQRGGYGSRQVGVSLQGGGERADFFLSHADLSTAGFNARVDDDRLRDDDGYDNRSLHARAGVQLGGAWRLDAVHRATEGWTQVDGCFAGSGIVHACADDYGLRASRLSLRYGAEAFSHELAYASTATQRENFALGRSGFRAEGDLTRWEYLGSVRGLAGVDLVLGADHEEALNDGSGRDNLGVLLEALSAFSDSVFLGAGLRHDDNEDFGGNTSHRLSGAWLLELAGGGTLKLKGSQGTGFRAPSPYEIAYNAGPFAQPPAAQLRLRQETSRGWEFGVEYRGEGEDELRLEALYFDQEVRDAITFDLAAFSGYLQDLGSSRSRGVELSASARLSERWRLSGNYSWNDSERPNGWPRQRRPRQLFNAGLSYQGLRERLHLNAFLRLSRGAFDEADTALVPLDDFALLDLSANYRLSDSLQLHGRVENLRDEDYQEVLGYRSPGRVFYLGFRLEVRLL